MSKTPPFSQPTEPLTVGNVVSAALRIYRDRFSTYFKLALTTYLYIFIPVYGWAKYTMLSGVISRLAFGEVREKPESVRDVVREVQPRMWSFFGAGFLTSILLLGVSLGAIILVNIIVVITLNQRLSPFIPLIGSILILLLLGFMVIMCLRLMSSFFIIEVALAVENDLKATSAISRSCQLTKVFVNQIQEIIMITFLITIPFIIVLQIVDTSIQLFFLPFFGKNSFFLFFSNILILIIFIVKNAFYIPFWQIVKAITYYDIRTQKEGLGLELHSHPELEVRRLK
ncbi:MAG: hypothetical protein RLZZ338_3195 [Cyanobacteriota bacterium]|jgi:hypothetical protein